MTIARFDRLLTREKFVVAPGWQELLRTHGLDSVDALYALAAGNVITRGSSRELRRLDLTGITPPLTLFIKKHAYPTWRKRWSGVFRGTFIGVAKVQCEFDNLTRLRLWGLDAPTPVAFGLQRAGHWLLRSVLVSEGVADAIPLDVYIRDVLPTYCAPAGRQTRNELLKGLADCTARMHAHRFVHHDFFWRNILLAGRSLQRFFLIDSHKGRCWGRLWQPAAWLFRAKDLATLDAPAPFHFRQTERLAFFLRYLGHRHLTAADKSLLRLVLHLARPMREEQAARVRDAAPCANVRPPDLPR